MRAALVEVPAVVKLAPALVASETVLAMSVLPCKLTVPVPDVKVLLPVTLVAPFRLTAPLPVPKLPPPLCRKLPLAWA